MYDGFFSLSLSYFHSFFPQSIHFSVFINIAMVLGVSFYFPVFFVIALCVCVGVIAWYFVFRKRQQEIDNAPVTQPTAADGHGATNPNTHNNEMYNYNNDPSNHGGHQPHPQGGSEQNHHDGGIYGNPQHQ